MKDYAKELYHQVYSGVFYNYPISAFAVADPNSPGSLLVRGEGRYINNVINVTTGGGANKSKNIFSFTGPFRLVKLWAILTDVTNIADFDDVGFDLYDGTNTVLISNRNPGGTTLNGYGLYSMLARMHDNTAAIDGLNSSQVRIIDAGDKKVFTRSMVDAKYGVTNYLRLSYDCLSAINVTMSVTLVYEDVSTERPSGIAAV